MPTFQSLESRRRQVLDEIALLPPMRRGSLVQVQPKSAREKGSGAPKKTCWRYTYKDKKQKTQGRHIATDQLAQTHREQIEAFRRFQVLKGQLLEVSHKMADLEAQESSGKKTLAPHGGGKAARD
jgi:hypothetical protein